MIGCDLKHLKPMDEVSILDLIVKSVSRFPNETATRAGCKSLTYEELFSCALANAEEFRRRGLSPGKFVLCDVDGGLELPLAWLTSILVGTVLVPIDAKWPDSRLAYALSLTQAAAVIHIGDPLHSVFANTIALRIDTTLRSPRTADATSCAPINRQVYGFFTSGSTGHPKCALNHQAGLVNRLQYMTKRFGARHVVLQNSSHVFDSSIWQILWPMTNGGTVIIPEARRQTDVEYVAEQIATYGVTMTDFVPSILRFIAQALDRKTLPKERLASLRYVLVGGEEMDANVAASILQWLPGARLINTYGHTEASIGMVFHEVTHDDTPTVPLGLPIDNTFVRVCNDALEPCATGDVGEIVVGGVCVGDGYLGQAGLTSAAFVANPFSDTSGDRVYRTGDLGAIGADGLLHFHGRRDSQVKIRGVRVELGEIETVVSQWSNGSIEAVATAFETLTGDWIIGLAYCSSDEVSGDEVREALRSTLPSTHVPKAYLRLGAIPLTQSGKADRTRIASLLRPSAVDNQAEAEAEPQTLCSKLQRAFRHFLFGVSVEPDTDFFECGGDSLDAIGLIEYLYKEFEVSVDAQALYENPSPARLARILENGGADGSLSEEALPLPDYLASRKCSTVQWSRPSHVLFTGATGFVGVHLLRRLLVETDAFVSVVVRGRDDGEARRHFAEAVTASRLSLDSFTSRIAVVCGDLRKPQLGVEKNVWARLCDQADTVLHAGANVNFLSTYKSLAATNVEATRQVLDFCLSGASKQLHYVSSLVAKRADHLEPYSPDRHLALGELKALGCDGYAMTKIASERLLHGAARCGCPVRIYRLDDVLPSLRIGFVNTRSLIHLLFLNCLRYAVAPRGLGGINATFVDEAAALMVSAIYQPTATYRVGTPMSPLSTLAVSSHAVIDTQELFTAMAHAEGIRLAFVDYDPFLAAIAGRSDRESRLLHETLRERVGGEVFRSESHVSCSEWDGDYHELARAMLGRPRQGTRRSDRHAQLVH